MSEIQRTSDSPFFLTVTNGASMRHTSRLMLAAAFLFSLSLANPAEAGKYRFAVKGEQVLLNDRPSRSSACASPTP